jgi:putative oxidoreductase
MAKSETYKDEVLIAARILLALLFLIFGYNKVSDYSTTVEYMSHTGVPMPQLAAIVATGAELIFSIAIILGVATRPVAILLAVYTLATALIGHRFWTMTGLDRFLNEINFFKNLAIIGGLLLLYVTGPGRYSVDARIGRHVVKPGGVPG